MQTKTLALKDTRVKALMAGVISEADTLLSDEQGTLFRCVGSSRWLTRCRSTQEMTTVFIDYVVKAHPRGG